MKKSSWIITSLVVVLGLVYWFTKDAQVSVGVKKLNLPSFEADNVDRIDIKAKEHVRLFKEGGKWLVDIGSPEHPRRVSADESTIQHMLEAALAIKSSHYVTNIKEKYKDLGLEGEQVMQVSVFAGDKEVWALVLGNNDAGSGKYAKIPNADEVFVVRGSFWSLTKNGLMDWRDRQIFSLKDTELTSFKIHKSGAPFLVLTKDSQEIWAIDTQTTKIPSSFREDKEAVAGLVRTALSMQAHGFVDEKKELSSPLLSIVAGSKDKNETVEVFSGVGDLYWAKRVGDEQIYEVNKLVFDKINKPVDELRDLSMLKFDKASIVKLTLKGGKERVVLAKKDSSWSMVEPTNLPTDFEFDPNTVDDMLSLLSGLHAQRIASNKDSAQNPQWQQDWLVELTDDKGSTVKLFADKNKASKDEYVVKGNVDALVYVIKTARIASLTHGAKAFKKEDFELPPVDENTRGFESLPVDVQRKLLDATKKK